MWLRGDLLRPGRLRADQTNIPDIGADGIGEFTGPCKRHIDHGNADPLRHCPRHVGRHALGIAGRTATGDERLLESQWCAIQNKTTNSYAVEIII